MSTPPADRPVPARAGSRPWLLVLGGLTAVAPLATDMYVPGLPAVGADLHASEAAVQATLTGFLVGLALGQLVLGTASDAWGRRRVLLVGTTGFLVFSAICAVAPGIEVLILGRLAQGLAGAAGIVLARAIVTDASSAEQAGRRFAVLSVIPFVGPVVAPVIGGLVLATGNWRDIFVALGAVGILLLLGVATAVPESLPPADRRTGGWSGALGSMRDLLSDRGVAGHLAVMAFLGAALFAYIGGAPFVFQHGYGVSATQYSLIFAANAVAMLVAGAGFGIGVDKVGAQRLLLVGLGISALAAVVLVTLVLCGVTTLVTTWACLLVFTGGLGLALPATLTVTQHLGRRAPGATSGLLGAGQFLLGGVAAPLTGALGGGERATSVVMTVCLVGAAIALCVARAGTRRRRDEPAATAGNQREGQQDAGSDTV